MSIENLRKQYIKSGLDEADLHKNPFEQFRIWFDQIQNLVKDEDFESNAMALATANSKGEVSNRIVLLKQYDETGFRFFTNYDSRKGQDLLENPHAAILFYWQNLERQVRIEGTVARTEKEISKKYFDSRPPKSRISAIISPQSKVVENRTELEDARDREIANVGDGPIDLPDYWGGYCLKPSKFEFWQGRENRLHDRLQYLLTDGIWQISRLGP